MTEANAKVHDPVCHMDIDVSEAAGRSDYEGMTYYFCSPGCKMDFDADPAGVLKAESEYDHSQPSEMMMMDEDSAASAAMSESRQHATAQLGTKKPWWQFWKS
jgi:Cu+-exporting ATPase